MLRASLNKAIADVLEDYEGEHTFVLGNAKFSGDYVRFVNLTITEGNEGEKAQREWDQNCAQFGLTPEDRNRTIIMDGTPYRIVEINPKRHKYPFGIVATRDGKRLKAPAFMIKAAMLSLILLMTACGYAPKTKSIVPTTCYTSHSVNAPATRPNSTTYCIRGNDDG